MVFQPIPNPPLVVGIRVFRSSLLAKGSAICLPGLGIFLSKTIPQSAEKAIVQHEYGHYLDYLCGFEGDQKRFLGSKILGFYLKIGLPSLFNLTPGLKHLPWFRGDHRLFWTEIRANRLASAHFGKELAEEFEKRFPSKV
ncbi:hypothetical protein Aoki45_32580 [Algoriphagus sp. oki45]|uniref:hypothetical protein n=1 Tax=Algoriphagus sp. oki45 TaxID=3067294 RepID=UPI0027FCD29D|nr:hypothetical protein Aoki45_32580 [Algoriphagus sp. oki45]